MIKMIDANKTNDFLPNRVTNSSSLSMSLGSPATPPRPAIKEEKKRIRILPSEMPLSPSSSPPSPSPSPIASPASPASPAVTQEKKKLQLSNEEDEANNDTETIPIVVDNNEFRHPTMPPIWMDDTAAMIKQKLATVLRVSAEEMYFYLAYDTVLSPQVVYSLLYRMQGEQEGVRISDLETYCANLENASAVLEKIRQKEKNDTQQPQLLPFSFLEELFPPSATNQFRVHVPFGVQGNNVRPANAPRVMIANPYEVPTGGTFTGMETVATNDDTMVSKLQPNGKAVTLYVCTAMQVIRPDLQKEEVSRFVSVYFPTLSQKIAPALPASNTAAAEDALTEIQKIQPTLLHETEELFRTNRKYYENVAFWKKQGRNHSPDLWPIEVKEEGITAIDGSYLATSTLSFPLPLDFIFKSTHATERLPFMRHVSSPKRDPLVRLYSPQKVTDHLIPSLPLSKVREILTKATKRPGLGFFSTQFGLDAFFFFELAENGNLHFRLKLPETRPPVPLLQVIEKVTEELNHVIALVNSTLKQTEVRLLPSQGLDKDVHVTKLDWKALLLSSSEQNLRLDANSNLSQQQLPVRMAPASVGCPVFRKQEETTTNPTLESDTSLPVQRTKYLFTRASLDPPIRLSVEDASSPMTTTASSVTLSNLPSLPYLAIVRNYALTMGRLLLPRRNTSDKDLARDYKTQVDVANCEYRRDPREEKETLATLSHQVQGISPKTSKYAKAEEQFMSALAAAEKQRNRQSVEEEEEEEEGGEELAVTPRSSSLHEATLAGGEGSVNKETEEAEEEEEEALLDF